MARFLVTSPLTRSSSAWPEVVDHPELIWGYHAPDLQPGRDFQVLSHAGAGSAGRIEAVDDGLARFTWGRPHWPRPGRFELSVGHELRVSGTDVPEQELTGTSRHWQFTADAAARYLNSHNISGTAAPTVVLFDADGVLQHPRAGWLEAFTRLGGPAFVVDAFAAELECLSGRGDLRPRLHTLLERSGTGGTVEQVLKAWHDIVIDVDALALVDRVRREGITVGLATNQQSYRGAHMRNVLDLDRHFDRTFYSYEVGHAKPSPAYFARVAADLGVAPARIVFVDDAPANIVGAREAGLRAALHRSSAGAAGLADDLRSLDVPLSPADH